DDVRMLALPPGEVVGDGLVADVKLGGDLPQRHALSPELDGGLHSLVLRGPVALVESTALVPPVVAAAEVVQRGLMVDAALGRGRAEGQAGRVQPRHLAGAGVPVGRCHGAASPSTRLDRLLPSVTPFVNAR